MEGGGGSCAHLAKAAAALTVLSLLPVALSGSAPSHMPPALRPISPLDVPSGPAAGAPGSSALFGAFEYDRGQVIGTYVKFAYNQTSGAIGSYLATSMVAPVLYIGGIQTTAFIPVLSPQTRGPIFDVLGYQVEITAHDDPTGLFAIRTDASRTVAIQLPASATNVSQHSTPGSWPASSISYSIGDEQARLVLGTGTFNVSGSKVLARMAGPDLLVFKAVPPGSSNKAEWRAVLDAIASGQVVAELDLVATSNGLWTENSAQYRIDVAAWPQAVAPGKAQVQIASTNGAGAVVLLAFDPATMPVDESRTFTVRANDTDVNRTANALSLFYAPESKSPAAAYTILPLPETVVVVYLPRLTSTSIQVESSPLPLPMVTFPADSALALTLALLIVAAAAARMFRRREA